MGNAKLLAFCFVILLSSCSKGSLQRSGEVPPGQGTQDFIGWNVSAYDHSDASSAKTRALVNDYSALRDACTHTEDREAEKIGIFGNYTFGDSTGVAFDNADLWWWKKEAGNPFSDYLGNESLWNYPGDNVLWKDNADYVFKAYFPKGKVELQPGSGAGRILAVYDSEVSQYDFMVAHRSLRSKSENPVSLRMQHALAALKFDFQFVDAGVTDKLLSCWLENSVSNGFYTSSTLNFTDEIIWPHSTPIPSATPFYYWEPSKPLDMSGTSAVEAYSTPAAAGKGDLFTKNSGWVLIVPQSSETEGTLNLCFKTQTGGDVVYRAILPAYDFMAGYRYTYHIRLTSTEVRVALTIAEWNERKSSYEVDFND